ncbi:MAG: NAD(+)/NADH kinase [Candidatus Thermoplasmatota archaeon]|nr:NAD(+)/NADH kinase [Candidatus Thermoplasmatota archaeon]
MRRGFEKMRWGLVFHPAKKKAHSLALYLVDHIAGLHRDGVDIEVVMESCNRDRMRGANVEFCDPQDMRMDLVISIGGDGTVLRTLRDFDAPVLGINVGSFGFLIEVQPENAKKAIDNVLKGNYTIRERSKLSTLVDSEPLPDAANEVVMVSKTPAKMVSYEMYINMKYMERIRGDGLIIATPMGSTCYAMSAGGAILDPEVQAMEIVPLSPFLKNIRPIVIPDNYIVTFKVLDRKRAVALAVDGNHVRSIKGDHDILIKRSKKNSKFVRFDQDFYSQLKRLIDSSDTLDRIKCK